MVDSDEGGLDEELGLGYRRGKAGVWPVFSHGKRVRGFNSVEECFVISAGFFRVGGGTPGAPPYEEAGAVLQHNKREMICHARIISLSKLEIKPSSTWLCLQPPRSLNFLHLVSSSDELLDPACEMHYWTPSSSPAALIQLKSALTIILSLFPEPPQAFVKLFL